MSSPAKHGRAPRWPLIIAVLVPPAIVAAIAVTIADNSPPPTPNDMWVGADPYGPTSTAPATAVQAAHDALHDIGAQCLAADPDDAAIATDVDIIIDFSTNYPAGRFPIDDETATASSLLLITQEAVKNCAPAEMGRLEAALTALITAAN